MAYHGWNGIDGRIYVVEALFPKGKRSWPGRAIDRTKSLRPVQ